MKFPLHLTQWGWWKLLRLEASGAAAVPGTPPRGGCTFERIPDRISSFHANLLLDQDRGQVSYDWAAGARHPEFQKALLDGAAGPWLCPAAAYTVERGCKKSAAEWPRAGGVRLVTALWGSKLLNVNNRDGISGCWKGRNLLVGLVDKSLFQPFFSMAEELC